MTRKVLADSETPLSAYRKLAANRPGTFLLESAENGRSWSRWSFIGAGAPAALTVRDGEAVWLGVDAAGRARAAATRCRRCARRSDCCRPSPCRACRRCPCGLVGVLRLRHGAAPGAAARQLAVDDLGLPDMLLLLATDVAAVDHHEGTITLIANAVNWNGTDERVGLGLRRRCDAPRRDDRGAVRACRRRSRRSAGPSRCIASSAPSRSTRAIVEKLVGDIEAGEAFQVVPSQRFEMDTAADPLDVYRMLRVSNPSPYMYLLNVPNEAGGLDFSIVGSSPEALVTVQGRPGDHAPDRRDAVAGRRPRRRTCCSRRSCWPTRRSAPST